MKKLNQYISEKLIVNNTIQGYNYHPKDKDELIDCIKKKIKQEGLGTKDEPLDLNDIDTSAITDMSELFDIYEGHFKDLSKNGYFDISSWDVSNVTDMNNMFSGSHFNGNLSKWDVSKVINMSMMFYMSKFNGDLSNWNPISLKNTWGMFDYSPLSDNKPKWFRYYFKNKK